VYIIYQIILPIVALAVSALMVFVIKKEKHIDIMLKIVAGLFFALIALREFTPTIYPNGRAAITQTVSILSGRFDSIFGRFEALGLLLIRWIVGMNYGVFLASIFFNSKGMRVLKLGLMPLTIILNTVFFKQNIIAFMGESDRYYLLMTLEQFFETVVLIIAYGLILNKEIRYSLKEDKLTKSSYLEAFFEFLLLIALFMPASLMYNLFGNANKIARDFDIYHISVTVMTFGSIIAGYFILRKKDMVIKQAVLMLFALAAFYQYFNTWYTFENSLDSYPFHICNTAVIFMPVALAFKRRGLFFFTYFCNVLGALFALIWPNEDDMFSMVMTEYWYNHCIDIIFPLLSVMIGVFERPTLKDMIKGLSVFIAYMIFVQIVGAYCNRDLDPLVKYWNADYFFLYGKKFESISIIKNLSIKLKFNYITQVTIDGHLYYAYLVYGFGIFVFFTLFSFVMWYVYDRIYLTGEELRLLIYKTRLKREKIGKTSRKEIEEIKQMMGGKTMIKISHFSKKYGSNKNYSVKDFSLTIEDGDVFGFIGHNGAGKSTVIKSLVGIQSITEGNIEVCGYDIEKYPLQAKLNIGYVSDNHAVYEKLTGREYINYVADLYQVPKEVREERINHYATMFGLTEALDREAKSYSHGMKQKLVVISSLIHEPKVWVLDEPLTGLDPTSSYQIKEVMKEHAAKGNIVFFSTHVIEVIEKLCTKIAIISHGQMMGVYKIADLKKEGISLESLYLKYVVSDDNRGNFTEADIATTDAGMFIEKQQAKEQEVKEEPKEKKTRTRTKKTKEVTE